MMFHKFWKWWLEEERKTETGRTHDHHRPAEEKTDGGGGEEYRENNGNRKDLCRFRDGIRKQDDPGPREESTGGQEGDRRNNVDRKQDSLTGEDKQDDRGIQRDVDHHGHSRKSKMFHRFWEWWGTAHLQKEESKHEEKTDGDEFILAGKTDRKSEIRKHDDNCEGNKADPEERNRRNNEESVDDQTLEDRHDDRAIPRGSYHHGHSRKSKRKLAHDHMFHRFWQWWGTEQHRTDVGKHRVKVEKVTVVGQTEEKVTKSKPVDVKGKDITDHSTGVTLRDHAEGTGDERRKLMHEQVYYKFLKLWGAEESQTGGRKQDGHSEESVCKPTEDGLEEKKQDEQTGEDDTDNKTLDSHVGTRKSRRKERRKFAHSHHGRQTEGRNDWRKYDQAVYNTMMNSWLKVTNW